MAVLPIVATDCSSLDKRAFLRTLNQMEWNTRTNLNYESHAYMGREAKIFLSVSLFSDLSGAIEALSRRMALGVTLS